MSKKIYFSDTTSPIEFASWAEIMRQAKEQNLDIELSRTTADTEEAIIEGGQDADIVVHLRSPLTKAVADSLTNCTMVIQIGIGTDQIDIPAFTARGIKVVNIPKASVEEVAVHSLALYLAVLRNLCPRSADVKKGLWRTQENAYGPYVPRVSNTIFAMLGFGNIARALAPRIKPLVKEVWAYDPFLPDSVFKELGVIRVTDMEEIWRNADTISVHLPLLKDTYHTVNAEAIAKMKPTTIIVGTSRGGVIDEEALADAIESNRLSGAGLDVFETEPLPGTSRLCSLDRVVMTAHQAAMSVEASAEQMQTVLDEIWRELKGEPLQGWLNKKEMGG